MIISNKKETNLNTGKCLSCHNSLIFQYVAMVSASLNVVCTAMQYGWPSVSLPKLLDEKSEIPLTNNQGSWVASTLFFGNICGSTLCAIFLDKLGRKRIMLISSCFLFTAWSIIGFATNLNMLFLGRFIGGLADGPIFCSTPVYLSEIASPNIRGLVNGFISVSFGIGLLTVCMVGFYGGMFAIALTALTISVISFLTIVWMPQSPYYLIMKNKCEEAKHSIRRLQPDTNVELEFSRLNSAVTNQITNTGKILDLFSVKSNRKAVYVMLGLRALQQLSGMCAFAFYAETIFKESADNPILFNYGPMFFFGIQIVVSILSSLIVDSVGRRPLLLVSLSGVCLVLLCQSCYFSLKNLTSVDVHPYEIIPTITLMVYVVSSNIGVQTIPLTMVAEIFPTNVKACAVGLSDVFFCVLAITATKMFQFTKDEFGLHISYGIFLICSVLGCIFIYCCVPETKGKTLEEIQRQLKVEEN